MNAARRDRAVITHRQDDQQIEYVLQRVAHGAVLVQRHASTVLGDPPGRMGSQLVVRMTNLADFREWMLQEPVVSNTMATSELTSAFARLLSLQEP